MKLSRDREGSKPVAMSDWPTLFYFIKMDFAKIPRIRKSVSATGAKLRAWYER